MTDTSPEDQHPQEELFAVEIPEPIDIEAERARMAATGLQRTGVTIDNQFDRGTLAFYGDVGGGLRNDSATEELPRDPATATHLVRPDGKGGSDGLRHDSHEDPHWNNPEIPTTEDEKKRARRQRANTSLELIESDEAEARRLASVDGNLSYAAALRQAALSKRSV